MGKSTGFKILLALIFLTPMASHAFPSFDNKNDMLKLLFAATENALAKGDPSKRTFQKLSDGKTYKIDFSRNPAVRAKKDIGLFALTLLTSVLRNVDPVKQADLKTFKRLLNFHVNYLKNSKVDEAEFRAICTLYDSPFIKGDANLNVEFNIRDRILKAKALAKLGVSQELAIKQLGNLLAQKNKSKDEKGFTFVTKVGDVDQKSQKYALKIRLFSTLNFALTPVK